MKLWQKLYIILRDLPRSLIFRDLYIICSCMPSVVHSVRLAAYTVQWVFLQTKCLIFCINLWTYKSKKRRKKNQGTRYLKRKTCHEFLKFCDCVPRRNQLKMLFDTCDHILSQIFDLWSS